MHLITIFAYAGQFLLWFFVLDTEYFYKNVMKCSAKSKHKSPFLMQSPKDGELFRLQWGMIFQVSNIIFPDENAASRCQYSKESDKIWCLTWLKRGWEFFEFFVRPRVVVSNYFKINHLGEGESTVHLRTNLEMSVTYSPKNNLWSISKTVNGYRKGSHVSSS